MRAKTWQAVVDEQLQVSATTRCQTHCTLTEAHLTNGNLTHTHGTHTFSLTIISHQPMPILSISIHLHLTNITIPHYVFCITSTNEFCPGLINSVCFFLRLSEIADQGVTKTVQWNKHKCTGPGSSAVAAILLAALGDLQLCITRLISAGSAFPHTSHLIEWLQSKLAWIALAILVVTRLCA